jgi:lysophospholipase L1-like esterase
MTLWVFGDSLSLPFDLDNDHQGWPSLLGNRLGADVKNFAASAADNFFIYSCYLENKKYIQSQDLCVVGWSHPSRKSFVFDQNNTKHVDAIGTGHVYTTPTQKFFRNKNFKNITKNYWVPQSKPVPSGKEFYDTWFENYYSEYEQMYNLQSYHDSVKYTCPAKCIAFFLSKESVAGLTLNSSNFALDFIIERQLNISNTNLHFNSAGHVAWADHLYNQL